MRAQALAAAVVLLTPLMLGGCASLSKEQCQSGNWREIGQADGAAGEPASQIAEHAKACESYGVAPNVAAYEAGRALGLQSYCTPASGFVQGREGNSYAGVCPPATAGAFQSGYVLGRQIYDAGEVVRRAESRVSDLENQLRRLEDEVATACGINPAGCAGLKQAQSSRRDGLRRQLDRAQWDLSDARNRAAILEASVLSQMR